MSVCIYINTNICQIYTPQTHQMPDLILGLMCWVLYLAYICIYIYTHTHIYINVYIYVYLCVYVYICVSVFL